jgi:hypothetical protein
MHTVLGERAIPLKTAGKIRPGIKVLTATAQKYERARALYEEGLRRGESFDQIERAIVNAIPDLTAPLAMRNTPYFVVRRAEMSNPAIADQIMELYGETREDGVRRLYRFPVVFPFDEWQLVVPHNLHAYTAGGLKYWSEYSPDGSRRYCMTFAKPPSNDGGRVIRIFGGRKHVRREDNGGLCLPEACPEYQARRCNLTGRIIFWIPGVQTLLPLEIPTASFYSLAGVISVLQRVALARGGRISGFLGQNASFWISKSLESVPRYDPESNSVVRTAQWIIRLDAPVDVAALLLPADDETVVRDGQRAAQLLSAPEAEREHGTVPSAAGDEPAAVALPNTESRCVAGGVDLPAQRPAPLAPAHADLRAKLSELGIDHGAFERYAAKRWGVGWSKNPRGVAAAVKFVVENCDNVEALQLEIWRVGGDCL